MGGLEEQINRLLGDPAEMEKLSRLASSLMEGGAFSGGTSERSEQPAVPAAGGLDARMLSTMGRLLSRADSAAPGRGGAMLEALKPHISERRREKLERAMGIARMAKLAQLAWNEFGGEADRGDL